MAQRTCTIEGCDRKHVARGFCGTHYQQQRYTSAQRHPRVSRTCIVCGATWQTSRTDAKFCTDKCKGEHYSRTRRTRCKLPADHPVMVEINRQREELKAAARRKINAKIEWRTARECPGCGCMFTPIYTPTMLCCSKRCAKRVHRRRRRAAEVGALGSWIWSDFMRIARRFDFRCAYCGERPEGQLDPDHVVPLSRGGYNSAANLLPACRACNTDKRDLLLNEWGPDRERRGLPPRITTWAPEDKRYHHLTQAVLAA